MDDMYHTCRWCKHFSKEDDKCYRGILSTEDLFEVFHVAESGRLSEVIKETIESISFAPLEAELKHKIFEEKRVVAGGKKAEELSNIFRECLTDFLDSAVKPVLDNEIDWLYQDFVKPAGKELGVEIKDPDDFYCKEWE